MVTAGGAGGVAGSRGRGVAGEGEKAPSSARCREPPGEVVPAHRRGRVLQVKVDSRRLVADLSSRRGNGRVLLVAKQVDKGRRAPRSERSAPTRPTRARERASQLGGPGDGRLPLFIRLLVFSSPGPYLSSADFSLSAGLLPRQTFVERFLRRVLCCRIVSLERHGPRRFRCCAAGSDGLTQRASSIR